MRWPTSLARTDCSALAENAINNPTHNATVFMEGIVVPAGAACRYAGRKNARRHPRGRARHRRNPPRRPGSRGRAPPHRGPASAATGGRMRTVLMALSPVCSTSSM